MLLSCGSVEKEFDIIVIGGGHAGAEAAWAASRLGASVAMITLDPTKIGQMSCNPAIGGLAKGQMVREIDALGGLMGRAIDATGIQFRMLNRSKGPAVWGPRAQADKYKYALEVQRLLSTCANLTIIAGEVLDLLPVDDGFEVELHDDRLRCRAVIITTGTFLRGLMHTGESKSSGGRVGEPAATGLVRVPRAARLRTRPTQDRHPAATPPADDRLFQIRKSTRRRSADAVLIFE